MRDLRFNMKLNKKAIIEDWIPLFVSLIIMVLIIVFFMAIKAGGGGDKAVLKGEGEVDAYQNLITYLRSNYTNENGNNVNIAEAIISNEDNFDKNYVFDDVIYELKGKNNFDKFTEEFFGNIYGKFWSVYIKDDKKLIRGYGFYKEYSFGYLKDVTVYIKLPISNKDLDISLTVYKKK